MENSSQMSNLAALVCGYERGGTTLLTQILKQHPNLSSGFECGFLLADEVSKFPTMEPFSTMIKPGWHITQPDVDYICQASDWSEAYFRLQERSPLCGKGSHDKIFDKTPKYMEQLSSIMKKVPDVPCVVLVRDPRAVLWSWAKRSDLSIEKWAHHHLERSCARYVTYGDGWLEAHESSLKDRILLLQYEELCTNQSLNARKLFDFIGLDFDESFLAFDSETKYFNNVYGEKVSSDYLCSYKDNFSEEICAQILTLTAKFKDWVWSS